MDLLRWKRRNRGAVGDERGGVAVELFRWKRRHGRAVGDERGGVAVELFRWKRRHGRAVGDERSGVAVELLGWKRRNRRAVSAQSGIVKSRITKRMIDEAFNGKYNQQRQKQKCNENYSFFHGATPPGRRMRGDRPEGRERQKTFRNRNAVSRGDADPTAAKPKDYSGLYGDYARLDSESFRAIDLHIFVAGFSKRQV
jgi:hypothetical protein